LAKALNRLREMAGEQGMALRNFSQAAAEWRALPTKPPIPEEVRAQRLLAETALKEQQAGKALSHYETGVEFYPVWPEGRFNAALIAAELKFYSEAVEQMRAYLELTPDSPDAQSARDQIVIWQDKATQSAAASPQAQSPRGGKRY
jgi:tetratricopeptide (TPR) repeat protein